MYLNVLFIYYGIDNVDFLGTAVCDGESEIAEKTYICMNYQNSGVKLLYSKISGTTVAPLESDGEVYDFYPLIEVMRKDIRDELPMLYKAVHIYLSRCFDEPYKCIIKGKFMIKKISL